MKNPDGAIDLTGYKLCVLDGLRRAIRRRDVFPVRSLRYADPRNGLLSVPAWEAARPTVRRTLGVSIVAEEELRLLSSRLDLANRETAERIPMNPAVTVHNTTEGPDLSLERLEKIEEPASLVALRAAINARLPRLDLPELIMEMHARTCFADLFTHASKGGSRAENIVTSICTVLVAEATNTGLEPLVRLDVPALRRSRLSWVKQNFPRAETLTAANAALAGLNAVTVPGTLRDSLNLLAIVLEQETEL